MSEPYSVPRITSRSCWICGVDTIRGYVMCPRCTPSYGETVRLSGDMGSRERLVFVGRIPFAKVVFARLRNLITVKWWMGTDALTLWYSPPGRSRLELLAHRAKMRMLEPFICEHWVTGPRLLFDLKRAGFVKLDKAKVVYWPGRYQRPVRRRAHHGFNIMYYDPGGGEYERWVYGLDVIEKLKQLLTGVHWIRLDGTQDLEEVLPVVDVYVRPSRHDGAPRIVEECCLSGIPVIFTEDGRPDVERIAEQIKALMGKGERQDSSSEKEDI